MKELSIKEKAKAYDEVLKKARMFYKDEHVDNEVNSLLEVLFPEFKESEDERIKKWIINEIKIKHHNLDEDNVDFVDKAISWLEKQGQTFTKKDVDDAYLEGMCVAKHELEKQGKQNPSDKVEPNFSVGNWVVNKFGDVWHIDSFDKKNYQVSNGNEHNYFPISKQKEMHLWTIKDAKDGDVLAYPDGSITMFNYMTENLYMAHVLWVDGHIELNNSCVVSNVHPATKEQRDILFQKMKEAGYKWDAENKKLVANSAEPSEGDKELTEFETAVSEIVDLTQEKEKGLGNICNRLLSLARKQIAEETIKWAKTHTCMMESVEELDEYIEQLEKKINNE